MAVHWQVKFKSLRADELYTVSIYDDSYTGNPIQLKGGAQPFETSEDISDDWFLPVRTQSGYLRFIDDGKDASGNTLNSTDTWLYMIPEDAKSRKVVLTDHNGNVKWQGYLQPQTFSGQIYEDVQEREFPIVCSLSVLGGIEPTLSDGLITFAGLLVSVLSETGINYDRVYFQGTDPIYWLGKKIDWSNFAEFDDEHHRIAKYTCFEILQEICKFWGWTCRTYGSNLYFVSPEEQFDVDFIYMTLQDLDGIDIGYYPQYYTEQWDANDTDTEIYASVDNRLEILRGIKKATVRCDFNKREEIISVPFDEISEEFRAIGVDYTMHGDVYHFYKAVNGSEYGILDYENDNVSIECYWDQSIIAGRFIAFEDYDGVLADKHNYDFNYVLNCLGSINYYINQACIKMVSKCAHSFNDGALTINADLLGAIDGASIIAYIQVGDKCWNGSAWVDSSYLPTFTITIKSNKFEDNRVLDGPYDAYTGYGIPVSGLGGLVDFRIVSAFDGQGGYVLNFTSLTIGFVKERTKALNSDRSQNIYTETTGAVFSDERTIDLIFATNNLNSYGLGFVMDDDGAYTYDVPYSYIQRTDYERPEEHLLSRLISRGYSTKAKELLNVRHDLISLSPTSYCESGQMSAYPIAISHKWRDDLLNVVLVQLWNGPGPSPVPPTPGRLPAGYTELAYLETDGACSINVGYALQTNTDDVEVDFYRPDISEATQVFGARNSSTSKLYCLFVNTSSSIRFGWGNTTHTASAISPGRHVAKIEHNGGILEVDGETSYTAGNASITTPFNCRLFAIRAASTYYAASGLRIYSFKLWMAGTITRNLVPAMRDSDSEVGFYDLVSDEFLTNESSGTFSYGTL